MLFVTYRRIVSMSFWQTLQKPLFVLAPMADVTDIAFRIMFERYGAPDVYWTEFVSADGLMSEGRDALLLDLLFTEKQRPIVAQLFTSVPEHMEQAAYLVKELGFDGVDINMGCPDRSIEKQGCGADMIKHPERAIAVIEAARKAGLPVSVKTRLGYNKVEIDTWIATLLSTQPDALTIHLRTRKEMSNVPAHWEYAKEIVALRNTLSPNTTLIGNGDVFSLEDGEQKIQETGIDGVMVGRGIFGNPWFFDREKKEISTVEKLDALIEHTQLFEAKIGKKKSFAVMKKHFKAYIQGFDGAKELRMQLMDEGDTAADVTRIVESAKAKILYHS